MSDLPYSPWRNPETVARFLQTTRSAAPLAIEQIDVVLRLITASCDQIDTFLNLGCGDGLLASAILDEQPYARGVLQNVSDAVLEPARVQLRAVSEQVDFRAADCVDPRWLLAIQRFAPFDTIVSTWGVHYLPDARKRAVYEELLSLLKPGGLFLNLEPVSSATRWTESVLDDYMIDAIFGAHVKASASKSRAEIAREYYALLAEESARLAPLEVQCDWLREIGFESVDVYLKVEEMALFGGQRPSGSGREPSVHAEAGGERTEAMRPARRGVSL